MARDNMQTVVPKGGKTLIHVETPLGIVNIYLGLRDRLGRRVESVSMLPNGCCGEPRVAVVRNRRFVEFKTVKV